MSGHIYLLREREFINANQEVYKLGKTAQTDGKRFGSYPKGSVIEILLRVNDHHAAERALITLFDGKFKKRKDIGAEYYEGDRVAMEQEIVKYIAAYAPSQPAMAAEVKGTADQQLAIDALKSAYHSIFYVVQGKLINQYLEHSMRRVHAQHQLDRVYNGADPMVGEKPICVDLNKFLADMKKLYGRPSKTTPVTSEQYRKYVGVHNSIIGLFNNVQHYEKVRMAMPQPNEYISFKLDSVLEIDIATFNSTRVKCSDYAQSGAAHSAWPY